MAHRLTLRNSIRAGQIVTWNDVDYDATYSTIRIRRLMEAEFK